MPRRETLTRQRAIYLTLLFYMVATPLIAIPTPLGFHIGAADILAPVTVVILLSVQLRNHDLTSILLYIFTLSGLVSSALFVLLAPGAETSTLILFLRTIAILLPFAIAALSGSLARSQIEHLFLAFLLSMFISLSAGVVLQHLGIQMRATQQTIWYGGGIESTIRAGGILGNSSDFGHLAAIAATGAILGTVALRRYRAASTALFLLGLYAVYLSSSRASLLHIALSTVPLLLLMAKTPLRLILALLLGLPTFGLVAYAATSLVTGLGAAQLVVLERLDFLNATGSSSFYESSTRLATWHAMLSGFQESPLLGIGFGNSVETFGNAGDNSFLSILTELGLASGVTYALFWAAVAWRFGSKGLGPSLRLVGIAFIFGELFQMLTVDIHRMWSSTPVFMVLAGLVVAHVRHLRLAESDATEAGRTRRPSRSHRRAVAHSSSRRSTSTHDSMAPDVSTFRRTRTSGED